MLFCSCLLGKKACLPDFLYTGRSTQRRKKNLIHSTTHPRNSSPITRIQSKFFFIPSTPHQLSDLFSFSRASSRDRARMGDRDLLCITWARVLFFASFKRSGSGCTMKASCGVRIKPFCKKRRKMNARTTVFSNTAFQEGHF